jgi:prepilin-type N-terminal cleavage/methylation domain-containing protein
MQLTNGPVTSRKKLPIQQRLSGRAGYTMSEMIIVIVVLGLLTAIAIPIYNNVRNAGADNVKLKNADLLNQLATTVHNGGVDMSSWVDSASSINALQAGVTIQSLRGAANQQIKLDSTLNPAAYLFTAGDATKAPHFDADVGHPDVAP